MGVRKRDLDRARMERFHCGLYSEVTSKTNQLRNMLDPYLKSLLIIDFKLKLFISYFLFPKHYSLFFNIFSLSFLYLVIFPFRVF